MLPTLRSLNLSNSVAIITYEILRQQDFKDLQEVSTYFDEKTQNNLAQDIGYNSQLLYRILEKTDIQIFLIKTQPGCNNPGLDFQISIYQFFLSINTLTVNCNYTQEIYQKKHKNT